MSAEAVTSTLCTDFVIKVREAGDCWRFVCPGGRLALRPDKAALLPQINAERAAELLHGGMVACGRRAEFQVVPAINYAALAFPRTGRSAPSYRRLDGGRECRR